MSFSSVCIVGLGYIGLPTAAVFASSGLKTIGFDTNSQVVESLNKGNVHIVEPGLEELIKNVVKSQLLTASTIPVEADAYIIAVPTPLEDGNKPDISYVLAAAKSIAPLLKKGSLVILESTSPVGTTEKISELFAQLRPDLRFPHLDTVKPDVNIAYCPERILPGKALEELINNDRIVGGLSPLCAKRAIDLYKIFVKGNCVATESKTAEMSKLVENSYRDVNIAFANELTLICDRLGVNPWELIKLANLHPRVNILRPGPGVGGHCIAVDPWFLVWSCPEEAKIIRKAREINDAKSEFVIQRVSDLSQQMNNPPIACFGLSFKPDIDDLRESPAVKIVQNLAEQNKNQRFYVVEPHISELPKSFNKLPNIELVSTDIALKETKIALMLVNHKDFYKISQSQLVNHHIFDTQNVWIDIKNSCNISRSPLVSDYTVDTQDVRTA